MKCFVVIASLMVAGTRADATAKADAKPDPEHPVPYGYTPAPYVHHPGVPVIAAAPEPVAPAGPPEPAVAAPVHHPTVPFTVFSPYHAPAAPVEPVAPAEPAPAPVHPVTPVYPGYGTPEPPVAPVEPIVHPVTPVYPGYGPPAAVAPPKPAAPVEPVAPISHPVTPVYPGYGHHVAPVHPVPSAYSPAPAHPISPHHPVLHHPTPTALPHPPPHPHHHAPPKCSKNNPKTWCLTDDEYPTYEIQKAVEYHYDSVQQMYKDVIANTDNSVARLKEIAQETYLCPSETAYIQPKRALNIHGKWRIIVNQVKAHYETLTQTARIEECTSAGSACPLVPECYETKCLQKSIYHRFLIYDPYDHYLPFAIESFKLPSACACYNGAYAEPPHKK